MTTALAAKATTAALSAATDAIALKADQSALDDATDAIALRATSSDMTTALAAKYASSAAAARIVEEKKFYDAVSANLFISGPDGVTEFDYSIL